MYKFSSSVTVITATNRLILFLEDIPVYGENHVEHKNILSVKNAERFSVKSVGTRGWFNHCVWKMLNEPVKKKGTPTMH